MNKIACQDIKGLAVMFKQLSDFELSRMLKFGIKL